jgi:hypothetical protein
MSAQPEKETHIELGGERLRLWSREHLSAQNVYAAMSDDKLVQQFDRYIERVGEQTPKLITAMRDALKTGEFLPGQPVSDAFLRLSIREGHGYGLGAAWGVSSEADLLWAGAARLMERAGYAPDEPVRMPEPKADPKPGGGSTSPSPGMGRR